MSDVSPKPPTPPDEDIDLYCLKCGYNLRGLSGDPRRCPECSYLNPMGDLELPAPFISAQLERMETAPTWCVAFAFLAGLFAWACEILALGALKGRLVSQDLFCCCGFLFLGMGAAWSVFAMRFRSSCLAKPGWLLVLLRFHAYGLVMLGVVIGIVRLGTSSLDIVVSGRESGGPEPLYVGGLVALGVCVVLGIWWLAPWLHARAKGDMEQLQREVAVQIARERLRRALASDRR